MNQLNQVLSWIFSRSQRLQCTPVFKTGAVTKILERLVYNQLNHFLEIENILFKHKFGFRKNYSTEQAILELTDNLKIKIDSNEAINAVFFLTYLKHFILSTIRSYYRNYTDAGSVVSLSSGLKAILKAEHSMLKSKLWKQTHFLSNGVYHKVLPWAHFCFLMYINDMPNCLKKANTTTFADDTTLLFSSNSLQDLEKNFKWGIYLLSYCSANKRPVNLEKTHHMTISSPQKANKLRLNLRNIKEKNYTNT